MTHPVPSPQEDVRAERRRAIGWALPQLVVLGLALTTMPQDSPGPEVEAPPVPPEQQAQPADPEDAAVGSSPPSLTGPVTAPPEGPVPTGQRNLDDLLYRLPFEQRSPASEKRRYSDLISLLRASPGPAISLINLWSPDCKPCKDEFNSFNALLATRRNVRFISIQLGKHDASELLPALPTPTFDLHDIGSGNGTVHQTLVKLGLARTKATIPITLVLDCQNRLRWLQARAFTEKDMSSFADFIDQRLAEMARDCPSQPAVPREPESEDATSPGAMGPTCGDGRCTGSENTETCCKDCGCPGGHRCSPRAGQKDVCLLNELMD